MLLCSFEIVLCCLEITLLLLPSLVSYLLVVGIVVVAAALAESFSSYCCSPIANLSDSSILNFMCWSRGFLAFDSY